MRTTSTLVALGLTLTLTLAAPASAQEQDPVVDMMQRMEVAGGHLGPAVDSFGFVVPIPDLDVATPTDHEYKVYFEAWPPASLPETWGGTHAVLDAAARFLNMHAAAGVTADNLQVAIVVYGPSTEVALGNEAYRARHGRDNPNVPLLRELAEAGARIYVCGQTATAFGVTQANKVEVAQMTLSAMTTLALLQAEGYVKVH